MNRTGVEFEKTKTYYEPLLVPVKAKVINYSVLNLSKNRKLIFGFYQTINIFSC